MPYGQCSMIPSPLILCSCKRYANNSIRSAYGYVSQAGYRCYLSWLGKRGKAPLDTDRTGKISEQITKQSAQLVNFSFHGTLSASSQAVLALVQEHRIRSETMPNVKGGHRASSSGREKRDNLSLLRKSVVPVAILFRVWIQGENNVSSTFHKPE